MAEPELQPDVESLIAAAVTKWAMLWDVPTLPAFTHVRFSNRLRRTRGRSTPATGHVVLSSLLLTESVDELLSVLCHEVAHVAAVLRYGVQVRPHGPEWSALVERAGFAPATHIVVRGTGVDEPPTRTARYPFVHVCPVCQTRRYARRPVSRWRCAECVHAGLAGELVVSRVDETPRRGAAARLTP